MRLAYVSLVAVLGGAAPAFADGAAPPPAPAAPPTTDLSTAAPAPAPPAAEPPVTPPAAPGAPDPDGGADFRPKPMRKDIVITVDGDRSTQNIAMLAGIAGAGALLSGLGLYYNLDSKSAADGVSPKHPTNTPWTQAQIDEVDRAHSSAVKAGIFYGVGGAVLIGAIVTFIVTQPRAETTVIHPHYTSMQPIVAPTPTGAIVGGAWRF
jgi:hypothetical protein